MTAPDNLRLRGRVGLVGLGLMGGALAERLLGGGFDVFGWDLAGDRRAALKRAGGRPATSARDVFAACDRLFLSLPSHREVAAVLRAARGGLRRGQIILDTSTGDPGQAVKLGRRLAAHGIAYLDATISGNSAQVRGREVLVMAGGVRTAFTRCQKLFACFAKETIHTGACGTGAKMKLVTNLVLGLNRAALAEGLCFARALRVDSRQALRVLLASAAYSRIMDAKGMKMVRGDFKPQARLSQHLKDVRLILASARDAGACLPLSRAHRKLLERAESLGFGDADNSAIIRACT